MKALFNEMGKFATEVFPDTTSVEHLKKLKQEADEALSDPKDISEYADCLLALFGAVYKADYTYNEFERAVRLKFDIVKKRDWEKLPDGTYQHIPLQPQESECELCKGNGVYKDEICECHLSASTPIEAKEGEDTICPECTSKTSQEELDMFGGWCEECKVDI